MGAIRKTGGHIALVRKIDFGLGQRQRFDKLLAPNLGLPPDSVVQSSKGLSPLRCGVGVEQIGQSLRLGEIHLASLEGPAGKLPGLRRAQAADPFERAEHTRDHGPSAMQMEFRDIFSGHRMRCGEPQNETSVEKFSRTGMPQRRKGGAARFGHYVGKGAQGVTRLFPGNTNNRNPRPSRGGGWGKDRVLIEKMFHVKLSACIRLGMFSRSGVR